MRLRRILVAAALVPALSLGISGPTLAAGATTTSLQSSSHQSNAAPIDRYCNDRHYWRGWGWWAQHNGRWDRVPYCGYWRWDGHSGNGNNNGNNNKGNGNGNGYGNNGANNGNNNGNGTHGNGNFNNGNGNGNGNGN